MNTLREAAQQALEALLTYEQYIQPLTNVFGGPRVPEEGSASAKVDAAITALRAALAEPVQEPVAWMDRDGDLYKMPEIDNWAPPHTLLYAAPFKK
jgi:hypothetical protein